MTFNTTPGFVRPIQTIWRHRPDPQTVTPKAEYLPWQARHWREFDNLLGDLFDLFPQAGKVFLQKFLALEAKLCPS